MLGGTISAVTLLEREVQVQVKSEEGEARLVRLDPTNYAIRPGDFLAWTDTHAFLTSQFSPKHDTKLGLIGVECIPAP